MEIVFWVGQHNRGRPRNEAVNTEGGTQTKLLLPPSCTTQPTTAGGLFLPSPPLAPNDVPVVFLTETMGGIHRVGKTFPCPPAPEPDCRWQTKPSECEQENQRCCLLHPGEKSANHPITSHTVVSFERRIGRRLSVKCLEYSNLFCLQRKSQRIVVNNLIIPILVLQCKFPITR